jgi:cytochrome P450
MTTTPSPEMLRRRSVSALGLDPFTWYRQMRESDPVHLDERQGVCELFRYNDILSVLTNPTLFSSERGGRTENDEGATMLVSDPPRHRKLRGLVSQAFTPRAIAQQEERIRAIVHSQFEAVSRRGDKHMDLIGELAYPLPVIVIAEMLGVPPEERDQFKRWSDATVGDSVEVAAHGYQELSNYFSKLLPQRRQRPQGDLISALLAARLDGEPLTDQEVVAACNLLLVAGNETTTNLIGNAMLCLDEFPEARHELWNDPTLVPGMLEEALRLRAPVQRITRIVKGDTEIAGRPLRTGQLVFCWLAAGNLDPEQFPHPERFDIRRSPNRHLAFGHGMHFCLGAPLARLESKVAFEEMIKWFQDVKRAREVPLKPIISFFGYGVEQLRVEVEERAPDSNSIV